VNPLQKLESRHHLPLAEILHIDVLADPVLREGVLKDLVVLDSLSLRTRGEVHPTKRNRVRMDRIDHLTESGTIPSILNIRVSEAKQVVQPLKKLSPADAVDRRTSHGDEARTFMIEAPTVCIFRQLDRPSFNGRRENLESPPWFGKLGIAGREIRSSFEKTAK
jgi:hypothetical protein